MSTILATGSNGLIGSEVIRYFAAQGHQTVGIDNDMRSVFFGSEASTQWNRELLERDAPGYNHYSMDIRDEKAIDGLFKEHAEEISLIVHAAAQPSHDWAAKDPKMDFSVNANGTLNILEAYRRHCPAASFVFLSTNKVYGDTPNQLPLVEEETRWDLEESHKYAKHGIDESMSIDASTHSLFGVSKAAADLMVQEYGRYFDLPTTCFRGGCLTGPSHSGTQLHGFLSYLVRCAMTESEYTIYGYKGKQVRDNIHSEDLVRAIDSFRKKPTKGEAYNMGGGRYSNCSMLEAIEMCEEIAGKPMKTSYSESNRKGDHIWWISDTTKFENAYPDWSRRYDVKAILNEIYEANEERWVVA